MHFGQTIKKLRLDANMTQEHLAELLSISPQAVSRWETNLAMPDISLLPPLANLFQVTTDFLLGMDTYQKDIRKAEFDKAFHEYWKQEDKEQNYQMAVRAVTEYPNHMEYIEWLARAEFFIAIPNPDNTEYQRLLESSIKHFNIVLEHSNDSTLWSTALQGIVLSLHSAGRYAEAIEYAMKEKEQEKRDELLCFCLEGKEQAQKVAEHLLNRFLFYLDYANKSFESCNTIEQLLKILFPDENYQYYHNTLQYNALTKSQLLCQEKRYDEAITELQKAKFHALSMVKYNKQEQYCFTAPLFNHVSGEKLKTESEVTDFDDFISNLNNNRCYEPLRDREDFKALYNKITQ